MHFLPRSGSASLDLRRGSPVRGWRAGGAGSAGVPGSPSSVASSEYVSVHDFSPRPSSSVVAQHSHGRASHARSGSLASKFSRAFSLNRRGSSSNSGNATPRISTADIGAPIPSPALSERWDGDYVRISQEDAVTPTRRPALSHSATFPGQLTVVSESERLARRRGMLIEPELYLVPSSPSTPGTQHSITPTSRQHAAPSPRLTPGVESPSLLHPRRKSLPASRTLAIQPLSPSKLRHDAPTYLRARDVHRPSLPPLPLLATTTTYVESPLASPISATSSSSRFRIRRKPPPALCEEDLFDVRGDGASSTTKQNVRAANATPSARPLPVPPPPSRAASVISPTPPKRSTFQLELDRLFDELYDECRSNGGGTPTPSGTGTGHRRSQSELPELLSANLRRGYAIRQPSRRILAPLRPDNVTLADPGVQVSLSRDDAVPKKNPFFQSGGGAGRLLTGRTRAMSVATTPTTPQTPGRVRTAVMEIERKSNGTPTTAVSTPIRCTISLTRSSPQVLALSSTANPTSTPTNSPTTPNA